MFQDEMTSIHPRLSAIHRRSRPVKALHVFHTQQPRWYATITARKGCSMLQDQRLLTASECQYLAEPPRWLFPLPLSNLPLNWTGS